MLSRIRIHNYKCLVEFDLGVSQRMLLVGSNGSGKSSLWEAIAAIQDLALRGGDVAELFPERWLTRWSRERSQRFALEFELGGDRYSYELEIAHPDRGAPAVRRERVLLEGETPRPLYEIYDGHVSIYADDPVPEPAVSFQFGRKRSYLPELEAGDGNKYSPARAVNSWAPPSPGESSHVPAFGDARREIERVLHQR